MLPAEVWPLAGQQGSGQNRDRGPWLGFRRHAIGGRQAIRISLGPPPHHPSCPFHGSVGCYRRIWLVARLVEEMGMRSRGASREATKRKAGPRGFLVTERTAKRRPKSGRVGSVTSTSSGGVSGGLLSGVSRYGFVRRPGPPPPASVPPPEGT